MNLITVGQRSGRTRHYVDCDRYNKLSKSRALCGKRGKELINFNAVYFNYELVYPNMCKKCLKISNKFNLSLS